MGASGITADHTPGFDPAGAEYHAPGTDRCSIADYGPVRNAHCPSNDYVVADLDTAGNPRCRHDQAASSHAHVMADLHQIVDLGASSDDGVGKGTAIYAAVRSDLHVILENAGTLVGHALMSLGCRKESETSSSNHCSGFEPHPVP